MAPELFQDDGVYSYFSDFWSLGCIIIEMATGKPPFYTNSLKELISQIMVEEVPVVSHFSDNFNDLLRRMLQKDPVDRINWDEIKRHPWWATPIQTTASGKKGGPSPASGNNKFFDNLKKQTYTFTKRIYQPQVHFDKYLQSVRKIDPKAYHQLRSRQGSNHSLPPHSSLAKALLLQQHDQLGSNSSEPSSSVDAMRISYNVMRNMQQ